ncbi:MAG: acyl-CoA desaturase [Phycisphaerales bacterium]|nr:acyl-CoA desaturase [Phycisphaerales bacterium]
MHLLSSPASAARQDRPAGEPLPPKPFVEHLAMGFGVFAPTVGFVVAIVLLWGRGVGWVDLALFAGFYTVAAFGITVGYHRLFTHRAFAAGPGVRGVLAACGSIAGQGSVLEWCATHRQHHKHSDRPGDPHSPHEHGDGVVGFFKGMWHAHMGWLFTQPPADVTRAVPDLMADPVLRPIDRYYWAFVVGGWVLPGAIGGLVAGNWMGFLTGFLWGGAARHFFHLHTTFSVNSVCHVWGTRPFKNSDESRNNAIVGVLTFGEGWHNNHHAFPTSARHGLRWYQLDMSWMLIRTLEKAGLAWDVRLPSATAQAVRRSRRTGGAAAAAAASAANLAHDNVARPAESDDVGEPMAVGAGA